MERTTADKIHVGLIITGLVILLIGFIYCVSRIWMSRGDEDDVQNMIIKKKFRRKSFTTGAGQPQNIQLGSTHGYFIKSPWLQDGVDRSQLERTDKSVDKFLQAVINDRHGHGY